MFPMAVVLHSTQSTVAMRDLTELFKRYPVQPVPVAQNNIRSTARATSMAIPHPETEYLKLRSYQWHSWMEMTPDVPFFNSHNYIYFPIIMKLKGFMYFAL